MSINGSQIAFLLLAVFAMLGACGVVFSKSPVRAAMSLVLNFLVLAALYFVLGAELLGISQIMVYAGAIMVLFLFVVMMLQQGPETEKAHGILEGRVVPFTGGAVLLASIWFLGIKPLIGIAPSNVDSSFGSPQAIGYYLFTGYVWPFEVASILLLVGIVGSIMLAKRRLK
ncbi:MAG: NADH-quinone oxidoreductase subunit J [Fimbriimonadaceae bacterium]|nr:NADH-quinone oxidoreductase subunit J [Fimbriimonadaceae bacterium]